MAQESRTAGLRVLLVGGGAALHEVLGELLDGDPGIADVHRAATAAEAREREPCRAVDVAVVDVDRRGLHLAQQLRALHPTLPVLLLTAGGDIEARRMTRQVDADGYVVKRIVGFDLLRALHAVRRGLTWPPMTPERANSPPPM